jgi:hypothetical protein
VWVDVQRHLELVEHGPKGLAGGLVKVTTSSSVALTMQKPMMSTPLAPSWVTQRSSSLAASSSFCIATQAKKSKCDVWDLGYFSYMAWLVLRASSIAVSASRTPSMPGLVRETTAYEMPDLFIDSKRIWTSSRRRMVSAPTVGSAGRPSHPLNVCVTGSVAAALKYGLWTASSIVVLPSRCSTSTVFVDARGMMVTILTGPGRSWARLLKYWPNSSVNSLGVDHPFMSDSRCRRGICLTKQLLPIYKYALKAVGRTKRR